MYRIYNQEYAILWFYAIGIAVGVLVYVLVRKGKHLNLIVIPSLLFSLGVGSFFWFKDGGTHGSGMIFFTFILIVTITTPRKYSKHMLAVVVVLQSLLVLADIYWQDLPIWGESPNRVAVYLFTVFVNLSVVWMLKYNYDIKEEKIAEFSFGLRELHRLNLSQNANHSEILVDYLKSGVELFNMESGLIIETKDGKDLITNSNKSSLKAEECLAANSSATQEIIRDNRTIFKTATAHNLKGKLKDRATSKYFIGSPLMVEEVCHGVLLFCAEDSRRKRFEDYDIELVELMAMNISRILNAKIWQERRQIADQALLLSERRFKSIYDYASVGICVCDMEGNIVMANLALQELLGFSEEELRKHTFYSISDSGDLEQLAEDLKLYEQIILGEIDYYILEKRKTTKDGHSIYISKTVSTIKDENDEVKFTVMIADDITIRKANEEKISRLNDELEIQVERMEEANKELEAFSYSVSHDLRAPLRAIDGFSKIILEDHQQEFSEESKRLLNVIITNSGKMAALIDDLLTFSRISRKVTEFKPLDFNTLVTSIIDEQALNADCFEIAKLPTVKGEIVLMKQVWSNLIGNAVKFSSKEEAPRIEIGSHEREGDYEFYVKDNGVGFNMAYYDKVFGVFQRLHTEQEFKGTGVGLAIVQKVMMKHHGKVWAESEEGKGTVFYFSLPKEKL